MYPVNNNAFAIRLENKPMHMEAHRACAYVKLTTKHYSMSCHANMNLIHEKYSKQYEKSGVRFSVWCPMDWSKRNNSGSFWARIWTARRPGQCIRRNMMSRGSIVRYTGFGASMRM